MRNSFAFVLILFVFNVCSAQDTWVRTLNIDSLPSTSHFDSSSVGPEEIVTTPNGTIILTLQINAGGDRWLIGMDSTGNIIWHKNVAIRAGLHYEYYSDVHPTIDNGCVYIFYYIGSSSSSHDSINRVDSSGNLIWSKTNYASQELVSHISQSCYNTTYVQFLDSLAELGPTGNLIQYRTPFSSSAILTHLPDSDFICTDTANFIKENFQGTIKWSIPAGNFQIAFANADYIYARSSSQVMKITTVNGNVIWTKPISSSALTQTSDLGFITIDGNIFAKYDSSGSLQWNKTILLPHFGLKCIGETTNKHYVSGGAWHNLDLYYYPNNGYSPILFCVDSLGGGIIDSVNYYLIGNANDNSALGFGDDAVYIAAALGKTGTPRDSLLRFSISPYISTGKSVFGKDWPTGFASGINYKFSDLDGNGIIDTNDIAMMSHTYGPRYNGVSPHWLKKSATANVADLKFIFEDHNLSYLDTIKIDVILGSQAVPSDSIYGLSFEIGLHIVNSGGYPVQTFYSIKPNSLGDTSVNLFTQKYLGTYSYPILTSMVLCRTDHFNTVVAGDTIARFYYLLPPSTIFYNPVTIDAYWNAINEAGYPLSLNLVTDTMTLFGSLGIKSITENTLRFYPNPTNDKLNFVFETEDEINVRIYDTLGNILNEAVIGKYNSNIDVRELSNGIYFISAELKDKIIKGKFIVEH